MKSGTHISIPLKYDLLLNQEIILLSEIKKISKNELINSIYFADFSYIFDYFNLQPDSFELKRINEYEYRKLINKEIEKAIIKKLRENFKDRDRKLYYNYYDHASLGVEACDNISKRVNNWYIPIINTEFKSYFDKEQHNMYNKLFDSISCIPNIEGTSRLYIRCEKGTINSKALAVQLESYFKLPLALRELYIFINNPIIKELFEEINTPKKERRVYIMHKNSIIPSQKHSYFKIVEGDTVKYLDLNNKKLNRKNVLSSKNNNMFITKEITVANNQLFFECLKYFVNRIFLVSNEDDLFTISGTERDIFFFQKMIS